jgi:hypothetical protein
MRFKLLLTAGGLYALVAGAYCYSGPNDPVQVSSATTYLTGPLAADGLPNYAQAILERQSTGITPENNGAILLWQAMGPAGVSADDFKLICTDLKIDPAACLPRFDGPRTSDFERKAVRWLKSRDSALSTASAASLYQRIIHAATAGRESVRSFPPLVAWLKENDSRLDMFVASAARPRFSSPPPALLRDPTSELVLTQTPDAEQLRSAACALALRANLRLSESRVVEAWNDVRAIWQLGEHANQGWTIVNMLVSAMLREQAGRATLAVLQSPDIPPSLLRQIRADLAKVKLSTDLASIIDGGERCVAIDLCLRLFHGRLGGLNAEDADALSGMLSLSFDESEALRILNTWYDRASDVAREEQPLRRLAEQTHIFDELSRSVPLNVRSLKPDQSSQAVGDALAYYLLDPMKAGFLAKSRDEVRIRILRVAVELAIHRTQKGAYPESLDELVFDEPSLLSDPYSTDRLIYRRTREGYVLYSVFVNQADDNGADFNGEITGAKWTTERNVERRSHNDCDIVICVPITPLDLSFQQPERKKQSDAGAQASDFQAQRAAP